MSAQKNHVQEPRVAFYERAIKEYAHKTQLRFVSRAGALKPFLVASMTPEALRSHVKDILLKHVLPALTYDPFVWPPDKINQTIDKAVNDYIATLVPVI